MTHTTTFRKPMATPNQFIGLIDELFNGKIFADTHDALHTAWEYPPTNVTETGEHIALQLLVPGRNKALFDIQVVKNELVVAYTQAEEPAKENNSKALRSEFAFKNFKRAFVLPESVDKQTISANYQDGILHIMLNKKAEEQNNQQRISVV